MAHAQSWDTIVIGLGAMGSATLDQLARREPGARRILGLEQYPARHTLGSSHGHHRMIRRSHWVPAFRPLVDRAWELWRDLEAETGVDLLRITGEVALLGADSVRMLRASDDNELAGTRDLLDEATLQQQFPGFRLDEGMLATYEATAGYLRPEEAVEAAMQRAQANGAVVRRPEAVLGWAVDGDGVVVTTASGEERADRLVLCAGAYTEELLRERGLPLQVVRIVNAYFEPERPDLWNVENGAPDFLIGVPGASYYGMSSVDGIGVKIGHHYHGEQTTARTIRRDVDDAEVQALRDVLDRFMPGSTGTVKAVATCMYTMTPDENYIIETHPEHPQVSYACGFSGTGFKFTPVIGEIMADLASSGESRHDLAQFSSSRFNTANVA